MRDIIYRGKPTERFQWEIEMYPENFKDGFIHGSLVVVEDRYYICTWMIASHTSALTNATATAIEVIPETIGQYTGLKDRNGKEIYEGDICIDSRSFKFCVEWDDENARFLGHYEDHIRYVGQEPAITIIGTIHDNPELLK